MSQSTDEVSALDRLGIGPLPANFCRPSADLAESGVDAVNALIVERFRSTALDVRAALYRLQAAWQSFGLVGGDDAALTIVLAEVLNNVVEHAYRENPEGWVCVEVELAELVIALRISDGGREMQSGDLPEPRSWRLDVPVADLPEGGFGWAMIHELTTSVAYVREEGCNRLSLGLRRHVPTR